MDYLKHIPIELLFALAAFVGGIARYLNGYSNGVPFLLGLFIAGSLVSGFAGFMFALLGLSMDLPQPILFIMAGTGGFFGDQTMKLILEYVTKKVV